MPNRKSSWRCFACGLRHCCISDRHWQSRQVEKVAVGHQVWEGLGGPECVESLDYLSQAPG